MFCRPSQENHTPREAEEGGPRGGHEVGWKGGALLPGSPSISQPVGRVCSLNSAGVCDSCEVTCLLSSCTVTATRPHSHCTDTNPTLDPSQGQNTLGHWAELALLCASTNLAKMSAFTHTPHHTLDPLQNFYPEPRDLPHFPCFLKFLFSRPDFSRNPSIYCFTASTHTCVRTLLVFVVALEQRVVPILLSLYIS